MLKPIKAHFGINAAKDFIIAFNQTEVAHTLWAKYFEFLSCGNTYAAIQVNYQYRRECLRFAIGG